MNYYNEFTVSEFREILEKYFEDLRAGRYKKLDYADYKWALAIVQGGKIFKSPCTCRDTKVIVRVNTPFSSEEQTIIECSKCGKISAKITNKDFAKPFNKKDAYRGLDVAATPVIHTHAALASTIAESTSIVSSRPVETLSATTTNLIKKGDNNMNTITNGMNLDFGVVKGDDFKLSHVGLAVKTAQGYRAYDKAKEEVIDVDILNFSIDGMIMKMPVAIKNITTGDVVVHQGSPMIVREVKDKTIEVVNLEGSEIKNILPVRNAFGFNFYTKIVSLIDMNNLGANDDSPFGSMLPLMMMDGMTGGNGKMDMNSMMPLLLMSGGKMDKNMMLMMAMMGSGGDNQMNPLMMMAMMSNGGDLFGGLCDKDNSPKMIDTDLFELPRA